MVQQPAALWMEPTRLLKWLASRQTLIWIELMDCLGFVNMSILCLLTFIVIGTSI